MQISMSVENDNHTYDDLGIILELLIYTSEHSNKSYFRLKAYFRLKVRKRSATHQHS